MKILCFTKEFPPCPGGISRFMEGISASFAQQSHEVTVLTEVRNEPEKPLEGMNIIRYPQVQLPVSPGAIMRNIQVYRTLKRCLHTTDFDLIIASIWLPNGTYLAAAGRPFLLLAHGTEVMETLKRGGCRLCLMRWTCRRAFGIACNSSFTEALVRRAVGKGCPPTAVVGCGVTPRRWKSPDQQLAESESPRKPSSPRVVLSVGKFRKRKGFDITIRAFAGSLYASDGKLVLVGSGPEEANLRELVLAEGVSDRVLFAGAVDDATLARFYEDAEVFILMNRILNDDYEGFGIVFLEAGLHGLAVIAGRNGGVVDAVEHGKTGYLVEPGKLSEVICYLDRFHENPDMARQMGANGRDRVFTKFTWEHVADRILRFAHTK